jgi:anti-sigma regulatory factor (Ser/Thr protein kinase)
MCAQAATRPGVDGQGEQGKHTTEPGGQNCSLDLDGAGVGSSRAARAFTRRCLHRWGVADGEQFGQDAVLVVSELVTNAHQHAEAAEVLRLRWQPPLLVIEVCDRGNGLPRVRELTDDLTCGRGMSIVERLVQRCQVVLGAFGRKTVRVEMCRGGVVVGR